MGFTSLEMLELTQSYSHVSANVKHLVQTAKVK